MVTNRGISRTKKMTGGLAVAGLAAASLAFGSAPAQASDATIYTFVPIQLTVHDIEDGWLDWKDEPRMYYGGAVWADVVSRGGYEGVIPSVDFTGPTMRVDLWERDRDWVDSNFLGGETVTNQHLNGERTLRFQGDWWEYELRYKVVVGG